MLQSILSRVNGSSVYCTIVVWYGKTLYFTPNYFNPDKCFAVVLTPEDIALTMKGHANITIIVLADNSWKGNVLFLFSISPTCGISPITNFDDGFSVDDSLITYNITMGRDNISIFLTNAEMLILFIFDKSFGHLDNITCWFWRHLHWRHGDMDSFNRCSMLVILATISTISLLSIVTASFSPFSVLIRAFRTASTFRDSMYSSLFKFSGPLVWACLDFSSSEGFWSELLLCLLTISQDSSVLC